MLKSTFRSVLLGLCMCVGACASTQTNHVATVSLGGTREANARSNAGNRADDVASRETFERGGAVSSRGEFGVPTPEPARDPGMFAPTPQPPIPMPNPRFGGTSGTY